VHKLKPLSETPLTPDFRPSSAVHSLVTNKMEIDWKKEGWNPQVPSLPARWPADKAAWVTPGGMIVM